MITQNETYVAISGAEGLEKMTEKRFNAKVKAVVDANAAKAEGVAHDPLPEAAKKQTFEKRQAENINDASELCGGDEKVLLTYFNRGYGLRLEQIISDTITDPDFEPTEEVYSLVDEASKLAVRSRTKKALSAEDLLGALRNLPKDQMAAILAEFAAAAQ